MTLNFANATETTIDINYSSDVDIHGYQFDVNGISLTGATDGGMSITFFGSTVLGYGMGTTLSAGAGSLVSLEFSGDLDG